MRTSLFPRLSVLDLVPVSGRQTSAQAIASSLDLAMAAERSGYGRYWFGEHHNSPAFASTNPAIMIAAASAITHRIRLGSGGVLLPLHPHSDVADAFRTLDAVAPGRIDLGLGRATTPQPEIAELLAPGPDAHPDRFAADVESLSALLDADADPTRPHIDATRSPDVWLLGASDVTASTAARRGLPFVYANHISAHSLARALQVYRSQFRPNEMAPHPRVILTVAVATGRTRDAAYERALPQLRMNARLRAKLPFGALETIEDARADPATGLFATSLRNAADNWIIATPDVARASIAGLADRWAVDEIMIWPVNGVHEGEPADVAAGRRETLDDLSL